MLAVVVVEEVLAKAEGQMYHRHRTNLTKMAPHKPKWEYKLIHLKRTKKMMCPKSKASWTSFSADSKPRSRKVTITRNPLSLRDSLSLPQILNLMLKSRPPSLHRFKNKSRIRRKRVKLNQQQHQNRALQKREPLENQQLLSLQLRLKMFRRQQLLTAPLQSINLWLKPRPKNYSWW